MLPVRRIQQISESHCGPAVLQMLLDAIKIDVTQEQIVAAAEAEDQLAIHGVRVEQLAIACTKVAPQTQFWYKYYASVDDIKHVLDRGYGVGVEWQGLFYESEEEEEDEEGDEGDFGHYSVVTYIDDDLESMIIVDPYKDFANQDRIFEVETFLRRWWDTNEVRDPSGRRRRIIEDEHLLFFVTPVEEVFDPGRNFKKFASVTDHMDPEKSG